MNLPKLAVNQDYQVSPLEDYISYIHQIGYRNYRMSHKEVRSAKIHPMVRASPPVSIFYQAHHVTTTSDGACNTHSTARVYRSDAQT